MGKKKKRKLRHYAATQMALKSGTKREALAVLDVIEWALQRLREILQ